jgi:hypothetical protein
LDDKNSVLLFEEAFILGLLVFETNDGAKNGNDAGWGGWACCSSCIRLISSYAISGICPN